MQKPRVRATALRSVVSEYLHSDDGVYEEKHGDQKTDVRKGLLEKRQQRQGIKTPP